MCFYYSPGRDHFWNFYIIVYIFLRTLSLSSIWRMWFYYSTTTVVLRWSLCFSITATVLLELGSILSSLCVDLDHDFAIIQHDNYFVVAIANRVHKSCIFQARIPSTECMAGLRPSQIHCERWPKLIANLAVDRYSFPPPSCYFLPLASPRTLQDTRRAIWGVSLDACRLIFSNYFYGVSSIQIFQNNCKECVLLSF